MYVYMGVNVCIRWRFCKGAPMCAAVRASLREFYDFLVDEIVRFINFFFLLEEAL